jgi:glucose-6-phosphate isomerase
MIKVDISNIWGLVSLPRLLAMEKEVFEAHRILTEGSGAGSKYLGWLNLPKKTVTGEIEKIQRTALKIRQESDICVVVGIGGSCLGSQAVIELLQGEYRNIGKGRGDPMILFAGNNLSSRRWNDLCGLLENKDVSVIAISKSGTTTEPAIALRNLRGVLEAKYGKDGANRRIYAVTDPFRGALRKMAEENGWETFVIPANVGGRFSVLTAVGLLPMAVAGIDILQVLQGAAEAKEAYDLRSFENPVWLYAAARNLLYRSGKSIEIISGFEPDFGAFSTWWQHLFSESEGKEGKGIVPVTASMPGQLHTLGQMIQEGGRHFFETVVSFENAGAEVRVAPEAGNPDGLEYLAGKRLDFVDSCARQGMVEAHVDGGVPVVCVECGALSQRSVGELIFFLELSCGISAYILGVNPFNQPGVERYKRNMYALLGKPGYER